MVATVRASLLSIRVKRGWRGERVEEVQHLLNQWALVNSVNIGSNSDGTLNPGGVFDDITERAVVTFQRRSLLLEDGVVGPFTFSLLARQPLVIQVRAQATPVEQLESRLCWAAATEYWLRHGSAETFSQQQVIRVVRAHAVGTSVRPEDTLTASNGLTIPHGQKVWENRFGLHPIVEAHNAFFVERVATRLRRAARPLLLGTIDMDETGHLGVGHVRVILGVQTGEFGGSFVPVVTFMDPLDATRHFPSLRINDVRAAGAQGARRHLITWTHVVAGTP